MTTETNQPQNSVEFNHYFRDITPLNHLDPYLLFRLYGVDCHEVGHAIKKLLSAGQRGAKDRTQDLQEAIKTIQRCIELDEEMEKLANYLANKEIGDIYQPSLPLSSENQTSPVDCEHRKIEIEGELKVLSNGVEVSKSVFSPRASLSLNVSQPSKRNLAVTKFLGVYSSVIGWFKTARPEPTIENLMTQIGCHLEEVKEMLTTLGHYGLAEDVKVISTLYKGKHKPFLTSLTSLLHDKNRRIALADDLCDQVVTATGVGVWAGFDMQGALESVNQSNYSKFDDEGNPVYKEGGKIGKGDNYREPDLEPYV